MENNKNFSSSSPRPGESDIWESLSVLGPETPEISEFVEKESRYIKKDLELGRISQQEAEAELEQIQRDALKKRTREIQLTPEAKQYLRDELLNIDEMLSAGRFDEEKAKKYRNEVRARAVKMSEQQDDSEQVTGDEAENDVLPGDEVSERHDDSEIAGEGETEFDNLPEMKSLQHRLNGLLAMISKLAETSRLKYDEYREELMSTCQSLWQRVSGELNSGSDDVAMGSDELGDNDDGTTLDSDELDGGNDDTSSTLESMPEPQPEPQPELQSQPQPEPQPESQYQARPEPQPEPQSTMQDSQESGVAQPDGADNQEVIEEDTRIEIPGVSDDDAEFLMSESYSSADKDRYDQWYDSVCDRGLQGTIVNYIKTHPDGCMALRKYFSERLRNAA